MPRFFHVLSIWMFPCLTSRKAFCTVPLFALQVGANGGCACGGMQQAPCIGLDNSILFVDGYVQRHCSFPTHVTSPCFHHR